MVKKTIFFEASVKKKKLNNIFDNREHGSLAPAACRCKVSGRWSVDINSDKQTGVQSNAAGISTNEDGSLQEQIVWIHDPRQIRRIFNFYPGYKVPSLF